jgi:hypothetical protein
LAPVATALVGVRLGALFLSLIGLGLAQPVAQPAFPPQQSPDSDRGVRVNSGAITAHNEEWRQRKDYALLFATNEYDSWEPLVNPIPDAEAIAAELKDNFDAGKCLRRQDVACLFLTC